MTRCSPILFDTSSVPNTDLSGCNFSESDFSGSLFQNTNLTSANLTKCTGYKIDPQKNRIKNAKFSLPEAMELLEAFEIQLDV